MKAISIKLFLGLFFSLFLASSVYAADNDRILDLEAQVDGLKEEMAATRSLAEQTRLSDFNPGLSVIFDGIGQYGWGLAPEAQDGHHGFHNGVHVRALEFEFRGSIDPWADAVAVVAIEQHKINHFEVAIEEAYARLKSWPLLDFAPFGIEIRAGKFKTALGRVNRLHLHNVPQINYPLATRVFLGDEGFASQGLAFNGSWAFSTSNALSWNLEGVMGNSLAMQEKTAREMPQLIGHLWYHQELAPMHFLDIGTSGFLGRKGEENSGLFWLLGGDIHYSYLPTGYGQNPLFLAGSELYAANAGENGYWPLGFFVWMQTKMIGSSFAGLRYDIAPHEDNVHEYQHSLSGYLGLYTSEFMRFRLGYEHVMPTLASFEGDHRLMLSLNFILGNHPVEPYFANR